MTSVLTSLPDTLRDCMSSTTKKPSGGRPLPRRLFSLDSLRKSRNSSESDAASISSNTSPSHWRKQSTASSNLLALAEKIEDGDDPFADADGAWTEKGIVQSPELEDSPLGSSELTPRPGGPRNTRANVPPLDLSTTLGTPATPTLDSVPPPSPSRRRWDTIRSHVLPSSSSVRSASPPPIPTPPLDGTSAPTTPRPSTPRGYRFGQKRSMRQVVDQARDIAHDETRRLTEEIHKACFAMRFGDTSTRTKVEREPTTQNTIGSTLHLPFLAQAAGNLPAQGGAGYTRQATAGPLKRPQSVMSLGTSSRSAPSVMHIARVLTSSTSANRPKTLPCETQVLAALLVPFLGPYNYENAERATAEQNLATETFELVIRTWRTPSSEVCPLLNTCHLFVTNICSHSRSSWIVAYGVARPLPFPLTPESASLVLSPHCYSPERGRSVWRLQPFYKRFYSLCSHC